jgi:hypothetical protein
MPDSCGWRRYTTSDILGYFRADRHFGIHRNLSVPVRLL